MENKMETTGILGILLGLYRDYIANRYRVRFKCDIS